MITMRFTFKLIAAVALLFAFNTTPSYSEEAAITISYSPGSIFHEKVRDRVRQVYERAGIPAEFVPLPHNRSLLSANEEIVAGDAGRVPSIEQQYTNLRRVDVAIMHLTGAAYVLRESPISEYSDALLEDNRVGIVLGVQWALKKMGNRKVDTVNDYLTLFSQLLHKRVDLVLATRTSAQAAMNDIPQCAAHIRELRPAVFTAPVYHYVHSNYAHLIPALEKAARELQAEAGWD